MTAPATCRHCGEQAGSTGSLSGLVHRWGPKDHRFEPLPTAEQSNAVVERMIAAETTILSTPATHPCDACGGRGDNIVTTAFGRRARECAGKHSWSRVARSSDRNVWICSHCQGERVWQRCPVCLTLRIAVAWSTMGPTARAGRLGAKAAERSYYGKADYARELAINAARAAFRAVPSLRGDDHEDR